VKEKTMNTPTPAGRATRTTTTNYVLYIAYDNGAAAASVWPSIAAVEANLGGLTGDLLTPGDPFPPPAASFAAGLLKIGIVDCRIIKCAAGGSTSVWFAPFREQSRQRRNRKGELIMTAKIPETDDDIDEIRATLVAASPLGAVADRIWGMASDPSLHDQLIGELADAIHTHIVSEAVADGWGPKTWDARLLTGIAVLVARVMIAQHEFTDKVTTSICMTPGWGDLLRARDEPE
jgi:hypothetical protein